MSIPLHAALLLAALIVFAIAALWSPPRGNLIAVGLALLAAAFLFG